MVKRRNIGRCLPSSARSAQKDIRETSFPAIFLPIPPGSLSVLSIFPSSPCPPSLFLSWIASQERRRTRELGRKKTARRDDRGRAGGYNFISRHETNERALRDAPVGRQICSSLLLPPVFEIT